MFICALGIIMPFLLNWVWCWYCFWIGWNKSCKWGGESPGLRHRYTQVAVWSSRLFSKVRSPIGFSMQLLMISKVFPQLHEQHYLHYFQFLCSSRHTRTQPTPHHSNPTRELLAYSNIISSSDLTNSTYVTIIILLLASYGCKYISKWVTGWQWRWG